MQLVPETCLCLSFQYVQTGFRTSTKLRCVCRLWNRVAQQPFAWWVLDPLEDQALSSFWGYLWIHGVTASDRWVQKAGTCVNQRLRLVREMHTRSSVPSPAVFAHLECLEIHAMERTDLARLADLRRLKSLRLINVFESGSAQVEELKQEEAPTSVWQLLARSLVQLEELQVGCCRMNTAADGDGIGRFERLSSLRLGLCCMAIVAAQAWITAAARPDITVRLSALNLHYERGFSDTLRQLSCTPVGHNLTYLDLSAEYSGTFPRVLFPNVRELCLSDMRPEAATSKVDGDAWLSYFPRLRTLSFASMGFPNSIPSLLASCAATASQCLDGIQELYIADVCASREELYGILFPSLTLLPNLSIFRARITQPIVVFSGGSCSFAASDLYRTEEEYSKARRRTNTAATCTAQSVLLNAWLMFGAKRPETDGQYVIVAAETPQAARACFFRSGDLKCRGDNSSSKPRSQQQPAPSICLSLCRLVVFATVGFPRAGLDVLAAVPILRGVDAESNSCHDRRGNASSFVLDLSRNRDVSSSTLNYLAPLLAYVTVLDLRFCLRLNVWKDFWRWHRRAKNACGARAQSALPFRIRLEGTDICQRFRACF